MQNNFEKEVQQKMEEMKLSPSAPLWEKIELEIRPEKKRRRVFFWIFIALLLIGGGLLIAITGEEKVAQPSATATHQLDTTATTTTQHSTLPNTDSSIKQITADQKKVASSQYKIVTPASIIISKKERGNAFSNSSLTNRLRIISNNKTLETNHAEIDNHNDTGPINQSVTPVHNNEQIILTDTASIAEKPLPAKGSAKDKNKNIDSVPILSVDTAAVKTKIVKQKNNWKKYIVFNLGMSQYTGGYQALASSLQYAAGSAATPQTSYIPPPSSGAGASFSIGYGISKMAGKKMSLSMALQYNYYSVITQVGSLQTGGRTVFYYADTSRISQYYAPGIQQNYTNKFATIELPVTAQYILSKKLSISAGGSYSRLIKSTALTYDHTSGTWYFNKENNKRNGLNLLAAIRYHFTLKGKLAVESGPSIQYNLLRIQNDNQYPTPHLFSAGLKTAIFF